MFELDEEHDDCRQCLLTIVARGTAIITEIYRLVELIPEPFHGNKGHSQLLFNKQNKVLLDSIICDFSYFKNADEFEARIESVSELKRADEQLCDHYIDILTRFYLTFEAVQRHASDLNRFIIDLEDEVFIGQSLDGVLDDHESRQLLSEAHFQLGYMLLLIDKKFDGDLRERLIVSYYRYSAYRSSPETNLDETCNLMRATGYRCHQQQCYSGDGVKSFSSQTNRPVGYPENYFARVGIDQSVVSTLIAKLQTVDVYNQTVAIFPHPDHRSNALAQQASILYIILYFCPNILKTQRSRMREITDKFFSDNWVVHIFMGEFVNLIEVWEPYRAARESLIQIHEIECVRSLTSQFNVRFYRNAKQLDGYLKEGWLNEDSFIENSGRILNCIRDSNVVLKWLLLHSRMRPSWLSNKLIKTLSSIVTANQPDAQHLCEFFLNLSVLEKKANSLYDKVFDFRKVKVEEHKSRACDTLDELVSIFNDTKPMRWVKAGANQGLARILSEAQSHLLALDLESTMTTVSRDVIVRLINRIESARESYLDGKSLQVVQLFMDTKENLVRLLRYIDLADNFKTIIQSVGDFSYGWSLMDEVFTLPIQQIIKDNPENMFALESVIMKLSSAFESQLLRIQQIDAKVDLISVSRYYSSKLVAYVKNVLQIIPETILELISTIMNIQSHNKSTTSASMPSRIHLEQLKDYSMPEQRLHMLQLTCKISHYAKGVMAMPDTAIGLVRIDSKRMLEDGLRRELAKSLTEHIQSVLTLKPVTISGVTALTQLQLSTSLLDRLSRLDTLLNSYKKSFEYIQDFLSIYGLKMWQEELSRIVKASVDQAVTTFLNEHSVQLGGFNHHLNGSEHFCAKSMKSIPTYTTSKTPTVVAVNCESKVQNTFITSIPATESNIIARILNELLMITNPRETIYDQQASIWFDKRHQQPVLDAIKVFKLIGSSLSVAGLNGLDRLCSALLMSELEKLDVFITERGLRSGNSLLSLFEILSQVRSYKCLLIELANENNLKELILEIFFGSLNQRSSSAPSGLAATVTANNERLIDHLLSIGRLQIIRLNIQCVLSTNCRYQARHLYSCLETLNSALLATIRNGNTSSNQQKDLKSDVNAKLDVFATIKAEEDGRLQDENQANLRSLSASLDEGQLVFELANYLEWIGLSDPMSKIYTSALHRRRQEGASLSTNVLQPLRGAASSTRDISNSNATNYDHIFVEQTVLKHSEKLLSLNDRSQQPAKNYPIVRYPNIVDGQPLYMGIQTILNHFQTNLMV